MRIFFNFQLFLVCNSISVIIYAYMRIDNNKCCDSKLLRQCRSLLGKNLFKAFNDESRQKIFIILFSGGEMTVNEVSNEININQSNVSRHLKLMKECGVAESRKKGREIYYCLNVNKLRQYFRNLLSIFDNCC